ncbi:MAG: ABC transporter ATP-binding protein/permease [Gammaproteobacteria bacterium]|nr:ABC transporter ATP-binding protein/permease [Gammaproteobacteria bacterium]
MPESRRKNWHTLASLLPFLWEFRARVILAMAFLVVAKLASVGLPLILKEIVDALDRSQNILIALPVGLLMGYGLVRLIAAIFGELRDLIFAKVLQRAIRRIAIKVFRHLHTLALSFHLERQTGGVSRDIERGSRGISFVLNFMLFNILPTLLEIGLVTVILLIYYDPIFAIITFVTVSIYITLTLVITEWRLKFRRTMNEMDSKANTKAIDSLINYETVKYFGNEDFESQRYDENMMVWEKAAIQSQSSLSLLNMVQGAIITIGITALLFLASDGIVKEELTLGDFVLINAYLLQLFIPLNFLGFVYREIKNSLTDMEKMFTLLNKHQEIEDKDDANDLDIANGSVAFKKINFSYQTERQILFDIDFKIPAGHTVAVVGTSGSGKSTLVRLLFRFYDVNDGAITINGQDIRHVTQHSLRNNIGIVPQDTVLFNDTIYYNIAYAKPDAERNEIFEAAKLAHIHEFIESMPDGYDTMVGERGLKLSGGEKQRVAIARTILKNPKILVFDEATSALDSKSERAIQSALTEVSTNHTTLVIAHRLSTIISANQILVMEKGRIIERGTHQQLLAMKGHYDHMWQLQQEEKKHSSDDSIDT